MNQNTPSEGIRLSDYFGVSEERVRAMAQGPKSRAEELGLVFNPSGIITNTRRAHLLAEYARDKGRVDEVHAALFRAYFGEGRNIGDDGVLREIAADTGLDVEDAFRRLDDGVYEERVLKAQESAKALGITGVPTFIVDDRYRIVGAHPYEAIRDALRSISAESQAD